MELFIVLVLLGVGAVGSLAKKGAANAAEIAGDIGEGMGEIVGKTLRGLENLDQSQPQQNNNNNEKK